MSPRRAFVIVILVGAVALIYDAARYSREAHSAEPPAASGDPIALRFFKNPAPVADFTLRDLDGRTISASSLRGKVTLINFWATWCGPCRAEIPDLVKLQEKYRDTLQIVGVLAEDESSTEVVRKFVADFKMNYAVVMPSHEFEKKFTGMAALPTSFVIDREGRIVQKHVGMLNRETVEAEARHLAGLPVNASIELVDQAVGLKLENGAQARNIPGVDLTKLSVARRTEALQKLNGQPCTCGCDLTVARCRVDDPTCGVSLPLAKKIVQEIEQQQ